MGPLFIVRDREKVRANKRRYHARHYKPVDVEIKRQNYEMAARRRWARPEVRQRVAERVLKRSIKRDLLLLGRVVESIRRGIQGREEKRVYARQAWESRGKFKRRQKVLRGFYIRAIRRHDRWRLVAPALLERALRKILRRRSDIERKLVRHLRRRFSKVLKGTTGKSKVVLELVGCSLPELRQYLERQFKPEMTWENYGFYGWHIDHVRPLAEFDLRDPAQQQIAFHFSNLQPLWAKDNLSKGSK